MAKQSIAIFRARPSGQHHTCTRNIRDDQCARDCDDCIENSNIDESTTPVTRHCHVHKPGNHGAEDDGKCIATGKEEHQNAVATSGWVGIGGCKKTGHDRDMCRTCKTGYTQYDVKNDAVGGNGCEAHRKREEHDGRYQNGFARDVWAAVCYVGDGE